MSDEAQAQAAGTHSAVWPSAEALRAAAQSATYQYSVIADLAAYGDITWVSIGAERELRYVGDPSPEVVATRLERWEAANGCSFQAVRLGGHYHRTRVRLARSAHRAVTRVAARAHKLAHQIQEWSGGTFL